MIRLSFSAWNRHGYQTPAIWISIAASLLLLLGGAALHSRLVTQTARARIQDSSLSLKVQPVENALLLSWDKNARLVATADRAVLTITDGDRKEDVDLNLSYFRSGQVVYEPISDDIGFKLEVSRRVDGITTHESVRVLNFLPQAPARRRSRFAQPAVRAVSSQPAETPTVTETANVSSASFTPAVQVSAAATEAPVTVDASQPAP
jgi:hypothetical protein